MSVSADYLTFVLEQLPRSLSVSSRRMFGGVGLYADGWFFALIDDDVLYFKVDDTNRPDFLDRGCKAFRPLAHDPDAYSMNYFEVPSEVLEDRDELESWAHKAVRVAQAAATKRKPRAKRSPTLGG